MLIELLELQSGISHSRISYVARTASKRYKVYEIRKRTGGTRLIAHPSRELKAIQRWVSRKVFSRLPVHECATAYKKGASIRKNAGRHKDTDFTLRMDFRDFFPSFEVEGIGAFIHANREEINLDLSEEDIEFICNIVTRQGHLTIGAPSSPILTNAMMFSFDSHVSKYCAHKRLIYTRYADDLFVSAQGPNRLAGVIDDIRDIVRQYEFANIVLNNDKTAYLSKKYRRTITGLNITSQNGISIGRKNKRMVKSLIFRYINGMLEAQAQSQLSGTLAFIADAEPEFFANLIRKYGRKPISEIMNSAELELDVLT